MPTARRQPVGSHLGAARGGGSLASAGVPSEQAGRTEVRVGADDAVRSRSGGLAGGLTLGLASGLATVLGYLFTAVLARSFGAADYGALVALLGVGLIGTIPAAGFQYVVARRTVALDLPSGSPTTALPSACAVWWASGLLAVGVAVAYPAQLMAAPGQRGSRSSRWRVSLVPLTLAGAFQGALLGHRRFVALGGGVRGHRAGPPRRRHAHRAGRLGDHRRVLDAGGRSRTDHRVQLAAHRTAVLAACRRGGTGDLTREVFGGLLDRRRDPGADQHRRAAGPALPRRPRPPGHTAWPRCSPKPCCGDPSSSCRRRTRRWALIGRTPAAAAADARGDHRAGPHRYRRYPRVDSTNRTRLSSTVDQQWTEARRPRFGDQALQRSNRGRACCSQPRRVPRRWRSISRPATSIRRRRRARGVGGGKPPGEAARRNHPSG